MKQSVYGLSVKAYVVIVLGVLALLSVGGWVANLMKIFGTDSDPLTIFLMMRFVGVFVPPVGSVMGYL